MDRLLSSLTRRNVIFTTMSLIAPRWLSENDKAITTGAILNV